MNYTKIQIEEAIMFFAYRYSEEKSYESYFESNLGLPSIVNLMTHTLFINKFSYQTCPNDQYKMYSRIYDYALEIHLNGFFKFKDDKYPY